MRGTPATWNATYRVNVKDRERGTGVLLDLLDHPCPVPEVRR